MAVDRAALAGEIKAAFMRRLETIYLAPDKSDDHRDFRRLSERVKQIRPIDWRTIPTSALWSVMSEAVEQLPNYHRPEDATDLSWRRLAEILGGWADSGPRSDGGRWTYKLRFDEARQSQSTPYGTFRKRIERLWEMLADEIIAMTPEQFELDPSSVVKWPGV